jgi:hypothetical protein
MMHDAWCMHMHMHMQIRNININININIQHPDEDENADEDNRWPAAYVILGCFNLAYVSYIHLKIYTI